jgi:hypothetical protein
MSTIQKPSLLTTSRPVITLFGLIFFISIGLVYGLLQLRAGLYDPEAVPIFLRLFVFGDYWPAVASLLVSPLALLRPIQAFASDVVEATGRRPRLF